MERIFVAGYASPLGGMTLAGTESAITGLWFDGQKYFGAGLPESAARGVTAPLREALRWLDIYFSGKNPGFTPPLCPSGSDFRRAVWDELLKIPYGETVTYGALAARLGTGCAQAAGGAVGHNPISLIIPCHRVVGADGSLTGYAGGIFKKLSLLRLEGADVSRLTVPLRGTTP